MNKCSICGQVIAHGDHHASTTDCIRYLAKRLRIFEGAVEHFMPEGPVPPVIVGPREF